MPKLKVGDRVYETINDKIIRVFTIDRVAATIAFSGNTKFRIESESGSVKKITPKGNIGSWGSYEIESDELILQGEKDKIVRLLTRRTKWEELSLDQLKRVKLIVEVK